MQKPHQPPVKKPYQPPVLTVYGTVQKLTQKVGLHGKSDRGLIFRIRTEV
jgi:hypothetical protein